MDGVTAARAGHPLPHFEPVHTLAQRNDRPGRGVAEGHGLVETVEGGFERGQNAFALHFVQHLFGKVRARTHLAEQRFFGKFDQHALRPG